MFSKKFFTLFWGLQSLWGLTEKDKVLPPTSFPAVFGSHTFCYSHLPNLHALIPSNPGFFSLGTMNTLGQISLCWGRGVVLSCALSNIRQDSCPLPTSSTPSLSHENQNCLQTVPPLEKHCSSMNVLWEWADCVIHKVCITLPSLQVQCLCPTLQRSAAIPDPVGISGNKFVRSFPGCCVFFQ